MTFGQSQGNSCVVITSNLEFSSTCRKKKHSQCHCNTFDVTRTAQTNVDTLQENRKDDYWNVAVARSLSDSWTGFTKCTLLNEKPPEGNMWFRERLTKWQATSRPDHLWPELWRGMSKNAKLREKHQWSNEKLHLENARKLRGIYFMDPEDKEFKETIKRVRSWKHQSLLPCLVKL